MSITAVALFYFLYNMKENKHVDLALTASFTHVACFIGLHYKELLQYASKGHEKCGRGYLNCTFESYFHIRQGNTIHIAYHNAKCTTITNIREHLTLVNSYDPKSEFVVLVACPVNIQGVIYSRYYYHLITRQTVIPFLVETAAQDIDAKKFGNMERRLAEDDDLFYLSCSVHPHAGLYTQIILEGITGEPEKKLLDANKPSADTNVTAPFMVPENVKPSIETTTTSTEVSITSPLSQALTREEFALKRLGGIKLSNCKFHCAACKKDYQENQVKKCSACHMVAYCSKECQLKDWKEHKSYCIKWRD
jgi:hypothetical protein